MSKSARKALTTTVSGKTTEILDKYAEFGCKSKGELLDRAIEQFDAVYHVATRLQAMANQHDIIYKFPHVAIFLAEVSERVLIHQRSNEEDGFSQLFEEAAPDEQSSEN